jgi:TonB family protein
MKVAVQLILTFLLNAFWQIALVAGFALVCDWLLRGTAARYRHGVWVAALLLSLTLPALSLSRVVKTLMIVSPSPVNVAGGRADFVSTYSPELDSPQSNLGTAQESAPPAPSPAGRPGWGLWLAPIHINSRLAFALTAFYGLFLLYRAGQLFRAWRRTRKIIQTAKAFELTAGIEAMIKGCKTAIGVTRVSLLGSPAVPVPITVGIRNPLIILPERLLQDVDEEVLTTAIGHELVHVARRDYLLNLIYEFIYLPLSFHPAAALVRRRIRQTRELCCDEAVATKLLRAETYARSLVRLVGSASLGRRRAADTAIGITESDILEVRIMSLLKTRTLSARSRRLSLIAATLILAMPCIAATSFALSFDIERQEPGPAAQEQSLKREQQVQTKQRDELKLAARQLEEQARVAPESKRAEIEARLREVQENLKQHETALAQFYQERESLKKAQELREILAQAERNKVGHAQRKLLEQELAGIEAQNSAEAARARENQQKLVESYQSPLDRKARAIYRVDPEYSEDARARKVEGTVMLGLTIDHEGRPQNIQVKRSLDPSLDQKAIEAVSKWRFEPAVKNGQPASMVITVEVYFALDSRTKEELEKTASQQREEQTGYALLRRRQQQEMRTQEERSRKQAELTRGATLSMDRAIQIATSQVPGKVLACSLGRDGDKLFYHVVIIGGDGDKTTATYVWVSATDGQILKTEKEKEERKEELSSVSGNDDRSELGPNAPIQAGVLNGKATNLPAPEFPAIARQANASGTVTVKVVVDESGNVVAAHAVSGHPLLQSAAVTAARQARFTPTRMSGEPVRVSGTLVYNFVTQ